jgi:hypothetical protein
MFKNVRTLLVLLASPLTAACSGDITSPLGSSEPAEASVSRSVSALTPAENPNSPYRAPNESFAAWTQRKGWAQKSRGATTFGVMTANVVDSRVAVVDADFTDVPVWSDADIKEEFRTARDDRFTYWPGDPGFPRRNTWLLLADGCYNRAELVASMAGDRGKEKPYKLFSFGHLRVESPHVLGGIVTWGYHVAPIVKSASSGTIYVLDPAMDPSTPLEWQDWLLRQVTDLNQVNVTVADSNAWGPGSPVTGGPNMRDESLAELHVTFLSSEWDYQQWIMGRDPEVILGDDPPWPHSWVHYFVGTSPSIVVDACTACIHGPAPLSQQCIQDCP